MMTRGPINRQHDDWPEPIASEGDFDLLERPVVAVIGSRDASPQGLARARRVGRGLAEAGVVVMSGLARGVDTHAMRAAIEAGGRVVGVIGTPLDEVYPPENADLQRFVADKHLLLSPITALLNGEIKRAQGFIIRNRLMATLSLATVVVEAGEKSGTRHQVIACARRSRPVCFLRSLADSGVVWVTKTLGWQGTAHVVDSIQDILDVLPGHACTQKQR